MKRIIGGKIYNTETAALIADFSFGFPGDFKHYEETLYRSPKGRFFLAGSGGAASKYSRRVDQNCSSSGEGLELLSETEALRWCEEHGVDPYVISQYFEIEEG